jgi:hypothetical protein
VPESDGSAPVWWENDRFTFAGLLGLSSVSIGQLAASPPPLAPLLRAALFCFVFALPFLYRSLHQTLKRSSAKLPAKGRAVHRALDLLGVVGAFAGFTLVIFQLDVWAGVFFLVCCLAVGILVVLL